MAFFNDDFHGFIGSVEYDKYLETLDFSDEDTSYVGLLKEEAEEKKAELKAVVGRVGDNGMVVFPDYKLVVFDVWSFKNMNIDKCFALQMFPDGMWEQTELSRDQLVTHLCNEGREASYDSVNGHLGEFLDTLRSLGVPVKENDRDCIASFASWADKFSDYVKKMTAEPNSELSVIFAERETARKDYEDSLRLSFGRVRREKPRPVQPRLQRYFKPEDKARYYARMAEKETVDFVKDRYAEKAEYWGKVSKDEEISPELEASCGPNHKWNAADNYVNVRHKLEKSLASEQDSRATEVLKKRVEYWERAAREEKKVNDMVREMENPEPLTEEEMSNLAMAANLAIYGFDIGY